ncbi:hypothetical protein DV514_00265, partial [Legionella pneumophila]
HAESPCIYITRKFYFWQQLFCGRITVCLGQLEARRLLNEPYKNQIITLVFLVNFHKKNSLHKE